MTRKYHDKLYSEDKYVTNFLWLLGMVMLKGTYFFLLQNCTQEEAQSPVMDQPKPVRQISWDFKSL